MASKSSSIIKKGIEPIYFSILPLIKKLSTKLDSLIKGMS